MKLQEMTIKELRALIRNMASDLNKVVIEKAEKGTATPQYNKALSKLQRRGGRGRSRSGIGYGSKLTRKADLLKYAQELQRAQKSEFFKTEEQTKKDNRRSNAKETFLQRHPDMTEKDFNLMGQVFGLLSSGEIEQFGSEQVVEISNYARNTGLRKKTLADIIKKHLSNEQNITAEDVIDAVRNEIDERVNTNRARVQKRKSNK